MSEREACVPRSEVEIKGRGVRAAPSKGLIIVLQDKVFTLMLCGQTDRQSSEHPWRLFRVFVRLEVSAFLV